MDNNEDILHDDPFDNNNSVPMVTEKHPFFYMNHEQTAVDPISDVEDWESEAPIEIKRRWILWVTNEYKTFKTRKGLDGVNKDELSDENSEENGVIIKFKSDRTCSPENL